MKLVEIMCIWPYQVGRQKAKVLLSPETFTFPTTFVGGIARSGLRGSTFFAFLGPHQNQILALVSISERGLRISHPPRHLSNHFCFVGPNLLFTILAPISHTVIRSRLYTHQEFGG